jgi:glycosyltransferase involved in cell wall biosynthesis
MEPIGYPAYVLLLILMVRGLAARLEQLAKSPGLLRDMSQKASERAKEYTWERYAGRLVSVISQICQGGESHL